MRGLISCVLATRNRPHFLEQAIRCFLQQRYTDSELIVVDDGDEPAAALCQPRDRITYIRLDRPTPLGTKMNIGIEAARGDFLQKLDDDDYYHPDFLDTVSAHAAEGELVAWDCFLILFAGELETRFSGHGWAAGGTLGFTRDLWRRAAFRALPKSVDRWFLTDHGYRFRPVCAPEQYILVRHGRNTWTRMQKYAADPWLRSLAVYPKSLEELVGPDYGFYSALRFTSGPRRSGARDCP